MGGDVRAGRAYIVGEKRPELFIPESDGFILPRVPTTYTSMMNQIQARMGTGTVNAPMVGGGLAIDRSIHIEMHPTYKHYESPVGILHDVSAAIASARR
jgi:hypothetical protein